MLIKCSTVLLVDPILVKPKNAIRLVSLGQQDEHIFSSHASCDHHDCPAPTPLSGETVRIIDESRPIRPYGSRQFMFVMTNLKQDEHRRQTLSLQISNPIHHSSMNSVLA